MTGITTGDLLAKIGWYQLQLEALQAKVKELEEELKKTPDPLNDGHQVIEQTGPLEG